jgi:hypothetical protein
VAGMAKGYNLSFDYVLYEMSYSNIIMYSSVLPSYDSDSDNDKKNNEIIDADDPANKEKIKRLLDN